MIDDDHPRYMISIPADRVGELRKAERAAVKDLEKVSSQNPRDGLDS